MIGIYKFPIPLTPFLFSKLELYHLLPVKSLPKVFICTSELSQCENSTWINRKTSRTPSTSMKSAILNFPANMADLSRQVKPRSQQTSAYLVVLLVESLTGKQYQLSDSDSLWIALARGMVKFSLEELARDSRQLLSNGVTSNPEYRGDTSSQIMELNTPVSAFSSKTAVRGRKRTMS